MAFDETTRAHYRRDALRYASDLTDAGMGVGLRLPIADGVQGGTAEKKRTCAQ